MLKKYLALVLALLMLCTLCACGEANTDETQGTAPTTENQENLPVDSEPSSEPNTEEDTQEPTTDIATDENGEEWLPAGPSGTLEPTAPAETQPPETQPGQNQPAENQPDTDPTEEETKPEDYEEDVLPWA